MAEQSISKFQVTEEDAVRFSFGCVMLLSICTQASFKKCFETTMFSISGNSGAHCTIEAKGTGFGSCWKKSTKHEIKKTRLDVQFGTRCIVVSWTFFHRAGGSSLWNPAAYMWYKYGAESFVRRHQGLRTGGRCRVAHELAGPSFGATTPTEVCCMSHWAIASTSALRHSFPAGLWSRNL